MDDAALLAEDVRRQYGDRVALDGVSLTVERGEVFALVGPNGAGKTTLVRALTGTTDCEGRVELFGDAPTDVERSRIGLLPQAFSPPARLTARELIDYYGGLYEAARDTDSLLSDLGLADSAGTWYENLSGGQRRRVCIGTALVNDPAILVLDEPTTGIDPAGRRTLWTLLDEFAAGGTTILLTTHDMAEAERLADRVGLLAAGRLAAVDTPGRLVTEHGGASRLEIAVAAGGTDASEAGEANGADETSESSEAGGASDARETAARGVRALSAAGFDATTGDAEARRSVGGETLLVRGVAPAAIGDVVEALDRADVEYGRLAWSEPDLEDAYLNVTGTAVIAGGESVGAGTSGADGAETRDERGTAVADGTPVEGQP
ncbi:ABC transporter ATP-binding protein [Halobacteriales archaeon QS_4_69_34]|nr:MAG: ABC transporter ATP-binding protein [Halobacteriales archaeon QS_4_69_34]